MAKPKDKTLPAPKLSSVIFQGQRPGGGVVCVGYLVQSFDAMRRLAAAGPASCVIVPLQQILREANAVCVDFARFALAYSKDAGSIEAAVSDLNQMACSKVSVPLPHSLTGSMVSSRLRKLTLLECKALDMWLTHSLTITVYGPQPKPYLTRTPLVSEDDVRAVLKAVIDSGELPVPEGYLSFVASEIFKDQDWGTPEAMPAAGEVTDGTAS